MINFAHNTTSHPSVMRSAVDIHSPLISKFPLLHTIASFSEQFYAPKRRNPLEFGDSMPCFAVQFWGRTSRFSSTPLYVCSVQSCHTVRCVMNIAATSELRL